MSPENCTSTGKSYCYSSSYFEHFCIINYTNSLRSASTFLVDSIMQKDQLKSSNVF